MRILLLSFLMLMVTPAMLFSEFPVEHPAGVNMVSLETKYPKTLMSAWAWRENGQVWVQLELDNTAKIYIQDSYIKLQQNGKVYPEACLSVERDQNLAECITFDVRSASNRNSEGNLICRVDYRSENEDYISWDYKKAFRVYYEPIDLENTENNFFEIADAVLAEIAVDSDPSEAGSVTGAGIYEIGQIIELTAQPEAGYLFSHWGSDTGDNLKVKRVELTEKDAVYSFTANFVPGEKVSKTSNTFNGSGCYIDLLSK